MVIFFCASPQVFLFAPTTLGEIGVSLGQSGRPQESLAYLWASLMRYPHVCIVEHGYGHNRACVKRREGDICIEILRYKDLRLTV